MREWELNSSSAMELVRRSDVAVVDIDGVVCVGDDVVAGAREGLAAIFELVRRVIFATNDSRRDRDGQVARLSAALPTKVDPTIVTSADALVGQLRSRGHESVCLWGPAAIQARLQQAGIAVDSSRATAVVSGAAPVGWDPDAMPPAGCVELLEADVDWFATNPDPVVPSHAGPIPDAGAIIERLHALTGRRPEICGKPHAPMRTLLEEHAAPYRRVIVIGDRLDSDIALAQAAGWSSILIGAQSQAEAPGGPDATLDTLAALLTDRSRSGVSRD